jgi:hypothetical protein
LLFLTTRVNSNYIDAHHLQAFIDVIADNVSRSELFASGMRDIFRTQGNEILSLLKSSANMTPEDFRSFFCIGFGKWLLTYLTGANPQTKVEMLPGYYYSIHAGQPDMLSLAYRCSPVLRSPTDRFGLVNSSGDGSTGELDEVRMALDILQETERMSDVDQLLARTPSLLEKMIEESAHYLEQASYDVSEYRDFAMRSLVSSC